MGIVNLFYGFFEAYAPSAFWDIGTMIGVITATGLLIWLMVKNEWKITL